MDLIEVDVLFRIILEITEQRTAIHMWLVMEQNNKDCSLILESIKREIEE